MTRFYIYLYVLTQVKDINAYGGAVELADFCPFYQKFTLTEEDGRRR